MRGYERLAESFATIVERAVAPMADAQPSQPLPALVAPDPRVETLQNRLAILESRNQSTPHGDKSMDLLAKLGESYDLLNKTVNQQGESFNI